MFAGCDPNIKNDSGKTCFEGLSDTVMVLVLVLVVAAALETVTRALHAVQNPPSLPAGTNNAPHEEVRVPVTTTM